MRVRVLIVYDFDSSFSRLSTTPTLIFLLPRRFVITAFLDLRSSGEPSITLKSVHSEHTAHINWMSTVPPGSENAPRVLKRGMMRP